LGKSKKNKLLQKQIQKQFSVDIQIPSEYKKGLQGDHFYGFEKK